MTVDLSPIDRGPLPSPPEIARLLELDPRQQQPYAVGDGSTIDLIREEHPLGRYVGGNRVFQPAAPDTHRAFVEGGYRSSRYLQGQSVYFCSKGRSMPGVLPLTVEVEIPKASLAAGHYRDAVVLASVSRAPTEVFSIGAGITEGALQGVASHGNPPTVLPLSRGSGIRSFRLGGPTVAQFGKFLPEGGSIVYLDVMVPEIGPLPPRAGELWKYWLGETFRLHLTGLDRHFQTVLRALGWGAREFRSVCTNPHGLTGFALIALGASAFIGGYSHASSVDSYPAYS